VHCAVHGGWQCNPRLKEWHWVHAFIKTMCVWKRVCLHTALTRHTCHDVGYITIHCVSHAPLNWEREPQSGAKRGSYLGLTTSKLHCVEWAQVCGRHLGAVTSRQQGVSPVCMMKIECVVAGLLQLPCIWVTVLCYNVFVICYMTRACGTALIMWCVFCRCVVCWAGMFQTYLDGLVCLCKATVVCESSSRSTATS
jgi:hypothetical protein